jgi:hypothetical protein
MIAELRFEPLGALASEILGAIRVRKVPIFEKRLDYILEREPPDHVQKALFEIVRHVVAQQEFSKRYDAILSRHEFPENETIRQTLARMAAEGDMEAEMLLPFLSEVAVDRSELVAVADFATRVGYSGST